MRMFQNCLCFVGHVLVNFNDILQVWQSLNLEITVMCTRMLHAVYGSTVLLVLVNICLIIIVGTLCKQDWFVHKEPLFGDHYNDVIMSLMASQITNLTIVYSTVYSGTDQIRHQSSASLAFVRGIHRWPVKSPHKGPVTRKMFPFDDVIMVIPWDR